MHVTSMQKHLECQGVVKQGFTFKSLQKHIGSVHSQKVVLLPWHRFTLPSTLCISSFNTMPNVKHNHFSKELVFEHEYTFHFNPLERPITKVFSILNSTKSRKALINYVQFRHYRLG